MALKMVARGVGVILAYAVACTAQDTAVPSAMIVTTSTRTFADTVARLDEAVAANESLSVYRSVDYASAVLPTYALLVSMPFATFDGNDNATYTTLLDLPHTILIWEDANAVVRLGYDSPEYFTERHSISGVTAGLNNADEVLVRLASAATGAEVDQNPVIDTNLFAEAGLVTLSTNMSIDEATAAIGAELRRDPVVVGLVSEIGFIRATPDRPEPHTYAFSFVFRMPSLSMPLVQAQPTVAINFPQRIALYTVGEETLIVYSDPEFLARRHNIVGEDEAVASLSSALRNFALVGVDGPTPMPTSAPATAVPDNMPSSAKDLSSSCVTSVMVAVGVMALNTAFA